MSVAVRMDYHVKGKCPLHKSDKVKVTGYVPYSQTNPSQTNLSMYNESNHELSNDELKEAIKLSGYTKKDKQILSDEVKEKPLTNTGHMWDLALKGVWKTMLDVDGWKLPATFDKYDICGKGYFKHCSTDSYAKRLVYSCGRIGCEVCAKKAGSRASKKIERRITLYGLMTQHKTKGRKNPLASHVIEAIDPKSHFWNYSKKKQVSILKKIRVLAGISGGAEINHMWAFDKSSKVLTPKYRPHKHLIAYGWIKKNASELIEKKYGIKMVYFKVRNGTLENRVDVFAVAFYQLSHCAVKKNKASFKWFGDLSYSKISNKELEKYKDEEYRLQDDNIEKSKHCPFCDELLVPAKLNPLCVDWRIWIPPLDELDMGCKYSNDLFVSVDYQSKEPMPYYDENFEVFYKQTNKQRDEIKKLNRPDLYDKQTSNQLLESFISK